MPQDVANDEKLNIGSDLLSRMRGDVPDDYIHTGTSLNGFAPFKPCGSV